MINCGGAVELDHLFGEYLHEEDDEDADAAGMSAARSSGGGCAAVVAHRRPQFYLFDSHRPISHVNAADEGNVGSIFFLFFFVFRIVVFVHLYGIRM